MPKYTTYTAGIGGGGGGIADCKSAVAGLTIMYSFNVI